MEFHFPAPATAPLAERFGRALLASPDNARLRPYAFVLDTFVRADPPATREALAFRAGWFPKPGPPRGTAARARASDVLVVGECAGGAELGLLARLVRGLVRAGRTAVVLASSAEETRVLRAEFGAIAQVVVHELPDVRRRRAFWLSAAARAEAAADWDALAPALRSSGAWVWRDARDRIREVAVAKALWRELSPAFPCETVIALRNYRPLSAVILAQHSLAGGLTTAFQHSIVTAPASFVPIPSRRFVVFGATSQALLEGLDAALAQDAGRARLCTSVIALGSLVDKVRPIAADRRGRALVIDSGEGFAPGFFGAADGFTALEGVVRALAAKGLAVTVRAHPRGGVRGWRRAVAHLGPNVEVSAGRDLADDLARAAVVIGLFSTVVPVAAACGVPTLFLWKPGWFSTPDLEPFARAFVDPASAAARVAELQASAAAWDEARGEGLTAAAAYIHGLRRCEFEPADVEAILAPC